MLYRCQRCGEAFQGDDALQLHGRSVDCTRATFLLPVDGITREQGDKLRTRRRGRPTRTEDEMWFSVYKVLFPDDDSLTIPKTPCKPKS